MRHNRKLQRVFVWLVLVITSVVVLAVSGKVMKTAFNLYILNDNIQFYNEQHIKTDTMTADVEENMELRETEFYESENAIVRGFSNSFILLKVLYVLGALATFIFVTYFWYKVIFAALKKAVRKRVNKRFRRV